MSTDISKLSSSIKREIQDFTDILSQIDISSLDPESLNELLAVVGDFKDDLVSIENLEELSKKLEQTLTTKIANDLIRGMKSSVDINIKQQEKYNKEKKSQINTNITLGYDKLTRD